MQDFLENVDMWWVPLEMRVRVRLGFGINFLILF